MIFAIDVGNTHIVIGMIEGGEIRNIVRIHTDPRETATEHIIKLRQITDFYGLDPTAFEGSILASVVPRVTEPHKLALEALTGKPVLHTVTQTEPVGPQAYFDVLAVAPCTGNTAAKLAAGITDTAVTMAVKSQLRGGKPVVLAFGSNDGLGASARNIGELLNRKNIYFVPMYQDDPVKKPRSLASDYRRLEETILAAHEGRQIEPILACPL